MKVWGMGSDGKPFSASALATELSTHGTRLEGEIVGVQYQAQKARFRVVWIGPEGATTGQIGIRALEPEKCIWQEALPSVLNQERLIGFTVAGVQQRDRRQHARHSIQGNVSFRAPEFEGNTWGKLADLSLGGCYVEVPMPAPKTTKLELTLQVHGVDLAVSGEVRTSVPGLGMGVEFTAFKGEARQRLHEIVNKMASQPSGRTLFVSKPAAETSNPWDSARAVEEAPTAQPATVKAEAPATASRASPQKSACDPAKFLTAMREFFSENDVLTREGFGVFWRNRKSRVLNRKVNPAQR